MYVFTSFTSSTSHYFDAAGKVNTPRSIKAKVSGSRPGSRSLSRHKLRKVSTVVTTVVAEGILRGWGHWGRGDRGGHVLVSPQGRCREKQTGCTTKLRVIKTQPLKDYIQSWLHSCRRITSKSQLRKRQCDAATHLGLGQSATVWANSPHQNCFTFVCPFQM